MMLSQRRKEMKIRKNKCSIKQKIYSLVVFIFFSTLILQGSEIQNPTKVLLVGTIHNGHYQNTHYSMENLIQILEMYKPDAICVEIRPEDFRKVLYLPEMTAATIWGMKRNIKVYPIDWWDSKKNARFERNAYMKTEDYKQKEKVYKVKEKDNKIIQDFNNKYGNWEKYSLNEGYEFYNGEDYNNYYREVYKISMDVYGDGFVNLYYKTRNNKMLLNINNVIKKHQWEKIIVLTGAEHKHYFDEHLLLNKNISVVDFKSILPLRETIIDSEISLYFKENKAWRYFNTNTAQGRDSYYLAQLTQYVHGPNMDAKPEIIPEKNISKMKEILEEWQNKYPESIGLLFEWAWYNFLKGNYSDTIEQLEKVYKNISSFYIKQLHISVYNYLGKSYDLIGNRQKAIEWYIKGEKACKKLGVPDFYKEILFKNYKDFAYVMPAQSETKK